MSPSRKDGIRPAVWIPAALVMALALGITAATLASHLAGSQGRGQSAAFSGPRADAAPPTVASPTPLSPTPAVAPPSPIAAAAPGTAAGAPRANPAPPGASSPPRRAHRVQRQDPELARQLYVAEEDAARQAIALGLVTPQQLDEAAAAVPSAGGETSANGSSSGAAAGRRKASDAFLEEYLLRKEYQAGTFPQGFPAAKDMRSVVASRIGNLDANDRLSLLNNALQEMASLPQQPRFESAPPVVGGASGG